jgi:hypothetical protein
VRIPRELATPTEKVVVASADDLVGGLGLCTHCDPPVESSGSFRRRTTALP